MLFVNESRSSITNGPLPPLTSSPPINHHCCESDRASAIQQTTQMISSNELLQERIHCRRPCCDAEQHVVSIGTKEDHCLLRYNNMPDVNIFIQCQLQDACTRKAPQHNIIWAIIFVISTLGVVQRAVCSVTQYVC